MPELRWIQHCKPRLDTIMLEQKGLDLLADRFVKLVDAVTQKAPGYLYGQYKNSELLINKGLPDYLQANYEKCESIRTLIKRDSPTPLADVYVPPNFKTNQETFSAQEIADAIGANLQRTIVTGLAGSGKSVFLKSLFRKSIEDGHTYYPVYFELRSASPDSKAVLKEEIFKSIKTFAPGFTKQQFDFGLKRGSFYLMIDALDEAPIDRRGNISAEISEMARKYPSCPIVLTSRPDDDFHSWEGFTTAYLLPFSKEQCLEYVRKIDFDEAKKTEFLDALGEDLFERHIEFLSNPLLTAMMLLTYDEYGEIPARRHVFFEKCFQVLLREHDVSKGRYRREFHSGLDYTSLEAVLRYFCVVSYLERKFTFNRASALAFIGNALDSLGHESSSEDLLLDLTKSICILQQDGDYYEFVHRSFQEYFYSKFVVADREFTLQQKISEFLKIDDVIDMVIDMDRAYFESDFILPNVKRLNQLFNNTDALKKPDLILNKFFANSSFREKQNGDEKKLNGLSVSYTVSHEDSEYEARGLNLLVYKYLMRYHRNLFDQTKAKKSPSRDTILDVFGARDESSSKRHRGNIPLKFHNREKLIILGSGYFAQSLKVGLRELENRLEKMRVTRSKSLSARLKIKK